MPRFEISCQSILLGWTDFEAGDPPMGVAWGRFIPSPGYAGIQRTIVAATMGRAESPQLSARVAGGPTLDSTGGVHISDYSLEFGAEGLEVQILGLSHPPYETLFPEHVAAYEAQFQDDD